MKSPLSSKHKSIGLLLSVTLVVTLATVIANRQANKISNLVAVEAASGRNIDVLGESYEAEDYKLSLTKIQAYEADELTGMKRVATYVTISNLSTSILQISPGLQMSLKDTHGTIHTASALYLNADEVVGGPIQPGGVMNMRADFDIASDDMPLEFIFQKDISQGGIAIKL